MVLLLLWLTAAHHHQAPAKAAAHHAKPAAPSDATPAPPPRLHLDLPDARIDSSPELATCPTPPAKPACRTCGAGIPDLSLSKRLRLGADGDASQLATRLLVYLKVAPSKRLRHELQLGVDVDPQSCLMVLSRRF
jgi:hypothetical protein